MLSILLHKINIDQENLVTNFVTTQKLDMIVAIFSFEDKKYIFNNDGLDEKQCFEHLHRFYSSSLLTCFGFGCYLNWEMHKNVVRINMDLKENKNKPNREKTFGAKNKKKMLLIKYPKDRMQFEETTAMNYMYISPLREIVVTEMTKQK